MKLKLCALHYLLNRENLRITTRDFYHLLLDDRANIVVYLDPPYYEKGADLYKVDMEEEDHIRLANRLKQLKHTKWFLSYDDHPFIRELYAWANIEELEITYTTAVARNGTRPKNQEILITPRRES